MKIRSLTVPLLTWSLAISLSAAAAADPSVSGIPNFHQVNEHLFRGGQPLDTAWPELAKLGVKTVVDLRQPSEHSTTAEERAVEAAGMRYVNFPTDGFAMPRADQLAQVLEIMNSDEGVFVHCREGKDRTGTAVAAYRISRDRWNNEQALSEAEACGMHWFERGMRRFISAYQAAEPIPMELARASSPARPDSIPAGSDGR